MSSTTEFQLRNVPRQARSRETFEKILVAAVELLEAVGWDAFNTNLLAETAAVRVSAVYRYFPNKETVLRTLAERIIAEWDSWFDGFEQDLEDCGDPVQLWCASIDHFYTRIQTLPGAMAIRRAMQISPELRELDRQDNTLLATRLAQTLSNYYAHLTLAQAKVIAVVLMETAVPIIDQALASSPAQGKKLLAELKRMHSGYISECTRPW